FGSLPIVLPRWILSWLRIAVSPPYRWRVHDVAAALLMNRFYENLMRAPAEGLPIAKALDEAREWLRSASRPEIREASKAFQDSSSSRERSGGESSQSTRVDSAQLTPYADPYYWAGFVVIGAPL
ncbi:MAG: CHAT domain-containing protein, partial [Planctomycetota bacterium]